MSILTELILKRFLKYFFIILIALEIFFVGVDLIKSIKSLPDSANLELLYISYFSFYILTIALPLSLVFAFITTIIVTIKNNELVSFYSLGASLKDVLNPILIISFFILTILVILQTTHLAYAKEQAKKIISGNYFSNTKNNLFLKYNNFYIYFKKLYPLEKEAKDIHIFKVENKDLTQIIIGKRAIFQKDRWYVIDAKIISKDSNLKWDKSKLKIREEKFIYTLNGFKPKILDNVYKSTEELSIYDAIYAYLLLSKQGINTNKIRANIYQKSINVYFVLVLLVLIFSIINPSSRFFNSGIFVSLSIFITLLIWGIIFMLYKLALGNLVSPEIVMLLPICVFFIIAIFIYQKRINI